METVFVHGPCRDVISKEHSQLSGSSVWDSGGEEKAKWVTCADCHIRNSLFQVAAMNMIHLLAEAKKKR
jgi:formate-dependent nitrite reductase cytochrome c552 subunit